ncbi:unnamed protein product [Schistosoma spindalis]|nr:unnamed protein product [Schistosoma spindale]
MHQCKLINGVNSAVKLFALCFVCIWALFIISKYIIHNQPELTQTTDKLEEIPKLSVDDDLRNLPLIFIGGHQSSGTGLLRVLLDVHPMVRCGPEPVVTREILRLRPKNQNSQDWLSQSGITQNVLDNAIAGFIVSILKNMGPPADRLCHKDPSSYIYLRYEASSVQFIKAIHKESLYAWSKSDSIIPRNLTTTMHKDNSLLARLGYTSGNIPPNYEELCEIDLKL